ncbi:MAG: hypothetical protein HZY75_13815 [Nocardioidaceae bacterium]|nr:MAG: hypothetical protein HZY75_13815 [Nocardioidaceae bacterium]
MTASVWESEKGEPVDPAKVTDTVRELTGASSLAAWFYLSPAEAPNGWVSTVRGHDRYDVHMVEPDHLSGLIDVDDATQEAFEGGALITTGRVDDEIVTLTIKDKEGRHQADIPAVAVPVPKSGLAGYRGWSAMSPGAAAELGLVPRAGTIQITLDGPVNSDTLNLLRAHGMDAWSDDPERAWLTRMQYSGLAVAGLLAVLVVGTAVALAAAESRGDVATLAAVGADPWTRRRMGAMHGLFLGLTGTGLGLAIGVPAGLALTQIDGLPGIDMAWLPTIAVVPVLLIASWLVGGLVTPSRFAITRRVA